jgi:probable F420-dependent oxidoreductase
MASLGVRLDPIPQIGFEDSIGLAQLAESLGYEMVWVPEGGGSDSITRLAAFAGATSTVRLGTGILPAFSRTPGLTAMTALGMHIISDGRFSLGLGAGHRGSAEGVHGIPFRRPMTRIRETVEIVRRLLRGESVTHKGQVFKLQDSSLSFTPVRPNVPIYLAALGPKMIELAGEAADGVLLNWASPTYLRQANEHVRRGAERAGRNPEDIDVACYLRTAVVDDLERVKPELQAQIARYFRMPYYRDYFEQMGYKEETAIVSQALARGDTAAAAAAISDEMQGELGIFGSTEHCRQRIEHLRSLGLKQPVIAPFMVGDDANKSFRSTIGAFSG